VGVQDRTNRVFQTGTLQLDFQLPQRFQLTYTTSDSAQRPVMIHRAILGSLERFFAILCEHTKGKWPFWISPRQIVILNTRQDESVISYARKWHRLLHNEDFYSELDVSDRTLANKIRIATEMGWHTAIIIGDDESQNETVTIRHLYGQNDQRPKLQTIPGDACIPYFQSLQQDLHQ
jgi:threonyl-tRNA synthetase